MQTKNQQKTILPTLKRRFAALPLRRIFKIRNQLRKKLLQYNPVRNNINALFLLQVALRKRYTTRQIRDIRKSARRRFFSSGKRVARF